LTAANAERHLKGLEPYCLDEWVAKYKRSAEFLMPFVTDTVSLLHERLDEGAKVLAEGSQSTFLDIELAPYPYGTSAHTAVGGALTGMSVGPKRIDKIIGVIKGVKSRVGNGPFVTEICDPVFAARLRGPRGAVDSEYGASTGRPRRIGYLDIPELRKAQRVNDITAFAFNKLDKLPEYGERLKVAVEYELNGRRLERAPTPNQLADCTPVYDEFPMWDEPISHITRFNDLPPRARDFIKYIEKMLEREISFIGVGPKDTQLIRR
jgi:adenylosuccinate synthase